jgi:hypothetical protein
VEQRGQAGCGIADPYMPPGTPRGQLQTGQQIDRGQPGHAERPGIADDDTATGGLQAGTQVGAEPRQVAGGDGGGQDQGWWCGGVHTR